MSQILSWFKTIPFFILLTLFFSMLNFGTVLANWRKDIGIFRIGIVTSEQSIEALDRLEPFKLALSEALDMEVEFFRARNATTLMNALADERIEYAIFSASGYALAWTSCQCIEPIAVPRSKDSTDGYHTVLISAPDGPKTLKTIAGNKIAILSEKSITGTALTKYVLGKQDIVIGDETTSFVLEETAEKTLETFSAGSYKLLIGWSSMTGNPSDGYSRGSLRQLAEKFDVPVRNYQVLWQSDQIPHRPHVMRKKLHGDAKKILRDTLLGMNKKDPVAYDSIEPVYGGGFIAARHERFEQLIGLMQSLDVKTKTAEETLPLQ